MSRVSQNVCYVCGEEGHRSSKCTELRAPKTDGFHKPSQSSGGGGGEDDEHLHNMKDAYNNIIKLQKMVLYTKIPKL
jgi:hypothetical protein